MTDAPPTGAHAARPWYRRLPLMVAALVVIALSVVLVVLGVLQDDAQDSDSAAAATTTAATPSAPATGEVAPPPISPSPTGPTSDATALPPSLEAVALDAPARVGEVDVSLVGIDAIQGQATAPGDVAGPALRVTVRLVNGTQDPLDLLGASVGLTYGADAVPASPLGDPSAATFSGTLEPGGTADAVYVFRVPADARDAVTVSVGYQPGAPYAVFTGAA
jgi:hypothetical protein